ncbi:voltage-dependent T-type calcium channel subunit alpha-1H-like [Sesbania bispinosa]|nr:voltage-dependent T-type calcium channel subunit alpha-1H-like [Sesbania bispinosa]
MSAQSPSKSPSVMRVKSPAKKRSIRKSPMRNNAGEDSHGPVMTGRRSGNNLGGWSLNHRGMMLRLNHKGMMQRLNHK